MNTSHTVSTAKQALHIDKHLKKNILHFIQLSHLYTTIPMSIAPQHHS